VAGLWFVLWIASIVWDAITVPQAQGSSLSSAAVATGVGLLGCAVLGIPATAGWLAIRGRWLLLALFAIYVSGLLLAWYLLAMSSVPALAGEPDIRDGWAAAGLLAVPMGVVVCLLAGVGTGIGATLRSLRSRRQRPCPPERTEVPLFRRGTGEG
jgi:hypothetical protein